VIPVVGFATITRFDLAERLIASIDYPVENLVIVNNSGKQTWQPTKPDLVEKLWHLEVPYGLGLVGAWNLVIKSTPYAPYWVLVNDDAWFAPGALETIEREVDTEALNFVNIEQTPWAAPIFGEGCVRRAGLYDEAFYPIYFDDNDYERRIRNAGVPIKQLSARIYHEPMTTRQNFLEANSRTWVANERRHNDKIANQDFSVHGWSLDVRRANRWD
jgi:GT2 family glycosyltransferase